MPIVDDRWTNGWAGGCEQEEDVAPVAIVEEKKEFALQGEDDIGPLTMAEEDESDQQEVGSI